MAKTAVPVAALALVQVWATLSTGLGVELDAANSASSGEAGSGSATDPQMVVFREATARVLEATHGWINCLLSARPRPPVEITKCTEQALPLVVDILVVLSTAGWAIRFKSTEELDAIRKSLQRMSDVRNQVHGCVESLNPHLQVAGRCYTVL